MKRSVLILVALLAVCGVRAGDFTLTSPDGNLRVEVSVGETITYSVIHGNDVMVAPSAISMTLDGEKSFGVAPRLSGTQTRSVNEAFDTPVYKRSRVENRFNELTLKFRDNYRIIFRAYDDGAAYRFQYMGKKAFRVVSEQAEFAFNDDADAIFPYVRKGGSQNGDKYQRQLLTSFESLYEYSKLSGWDPDRLAFLPLVVEGPGGKKVCITEVDLFDYPGMFLSNMDAGRTLKGYHAGYPKATTIGGGNLYSIVTDWEDHIARVNGPAAFPWRVIIVATDDTELADSDMVYKLATPPTGDFSWVKPGKVAWDWWNEWNIYGVDFESGVNNETYKYYIDFASQHGIGYIILDEGWAEDMKADLMLVVPQIDLKMLVDYAAERNVGLILWAGFRAFDRDMENTCRHYSEMGIKGFKIDFMDRDDQVMVDFNRRAAETAAKYHMVIDFHGTYKPTGLHRTYPNVLNFEGVFGLEQVKWTEKMDQVTYDVTIPFIRQVAGPMDYTQGAMRNSTKNSYRSISDEGMSQGTRCRQLAQYVIFESPLNMLCDSPSNYMKEEECTEFIAGAPTVWDQTKVLNGEIAKYVTIARRSGQTWYVGSLTDWDARELELDLSFLGEGDFKAVIYRDGANANRIARDYKKETIEIPADRKLKIGMAPGGGWAAKIVREG